MTNKTFLPALLLVLLAGSCIFSQDLNIAKLKDKTADNSRFILTDKIEKQYIVNSKTRSVALIDKNLVSDNISKNIKSNLRTDPKPKNLYCLVERFRQ